MDFNKIYNKIKEERLFGRYITNSHIKPIIDHLPDQFKIETIGYSVQKKPIYSVQIGNGNIKILMWSQMHGNESTTTKAVFDLFSFLDSDEKDAAIIKKNYTILCIPILNPDGAEVYTRENANQIDLNRDAVNLTQPESVILRNIYNEFQPNFCYNLHDQRTIYAAGNTNNPATVSFLAPAFNEARGLNSTRTKAIRVIVAMNEELQKHIPNQIGRFDDTFNINCVGETFQSLNTPTILFEAGHFQNDYQREQTRKFIWIALIVGIKKCYENEIVSNEINDYLAIPQNKVHFNDLMYIKFKINTNNKNLIISFAANYEEILRNNQIVFEAIFSEINDSTQNFGHQEYNGEEGIYTDDYENLPKIGQKANFYLNKSIKFVNGLKEM